MNSYIFDVYDAEESGPIWGRLQISAKTQQAAISKSMTWLRREVRQGRTQCNLEKVRFIPVYAEETEDIQDHNPMRNP